MHTVQAPQPAYVPQHHQTHASHIPTQQSYVPHQTHGGGYAVPAGAPVMVVTQPEPSHTSYILLACLTFWLCNSLFGLIAVILSIPGVSRQRASEHRFQGARNCGRASRCVSVIGICATIVVIVTLLIVSINTEDEPEQEDGEDGGSGENGGSDEDDLSSGSTAAVMSWTCALFSVVVTFIFRCDS